MEKQVENKVENQVEEKVKSQVESQVEEKEEKKVEAQVEENVEVQQESPVDENVEKELAPTDEDKNQQKSNHAKTEDHAGDQAEMKEEAEKSKKPAAVKVIKHKELQPVAAFANMLETIAKKIKEEQQFTFVQGEKSTVIKLSDQVKVEIEYETKGDKHSFEIEFEWYTGEAQPKQAKIK